MIREKDGKPVIIDFGRATCENELKDKAAFNRYAKLEREELEEILRIRMKENIETEQDSEEDGEGEVKETNVDFKKDSPDLPEDIAGLDDKRHDNENTIDFIVKNKKMKIEEG